VEEYPRPVEAQGWPAKGLFYSWKVNKVKGNKTKIKINKNKLKQNIT
jgi:hypothetical protein